MEQIRVLHMIGSLNVGGSQAMVVNLYRAIDRTKIQFDFIIDHPDEIYFEKMVTELGAKVYVMPAFTGKNILNIKKKWEKFFVDHPEYKILHSHVRSYASLYIPIAKKCGLKTIIHSHSTSNGSGISSLVKRIMQYPLRYQADYLMACSSEAGEWLYGKKACKNSNYIFFSNAIDTDKYMYSKETANKYRREMGLDGKFVVGHVGRFHEAKNHMFLLDVFAEICAKRSDAMLLLVGDGDLRDSIEEKIHSLGLEKRVILTGSRNDVPDLMKAMDVFVFPSKWEGLPVTVVEAQAAGLPCLVSNQVTSEVAVSDAVTYLPINQGTALWAKSVLQFAGKRFNVIEDIKAAGFDVNKSAAELTEFYRSIYE